MTVRSGLINLSLLKRDLLGRSGEVLVRPPGKYDRAAVCVEAKREHAVVVAR
jgi:hypothetical protein